MVTQLLRLKVTMNIEIFWKKRRIKLDWKSMEDYEIDNYSGPEVYL